MKKPIRILHILQRMEAAGIQNFLMNIYRNVDREIIQFDFLVQYKEEEFFDKEISSLGGRIFKFSVREDYNIIKYRNEIRHFFETHNEYTIVHGHMETLSNIWEEEAYRAGIPVIIAHSHTAGFNEKNILKLMVKEFFRKQYGRYANVFLACSNAAGEFMFRDKKYEVVPNAIDVNRFRYSQDKRSIRKLLDLEDNFVIGHVGRFHPSKNHTFIIDVAEEMIKKVPNTKFLLVGDGEVKEQVEKDVAKRNLTNVFVFMGNRKDVDALYSAMDVFIMPSLFEGLPLVGVEAQAAGLPCLYSDTITRELGLTDLAEFLPIDSGISKWVKRLVHISNSIVLREKYADVVKEKGYDIKRLAYKLSEMYLEFCGGQTNE